MHSRTFAALWAVFAFMAVCAGVRQTAYAAPRAAQSGLVYVVRYTGDADPRVIELLKQVSKAEGLIQSPPDSALLLERRAGEDKAAFAKVFQSEGYFAAAITVSLDQTVSPAVLTYAIKAGPRFTLAKVTLVVPPDHPGRDAALPTPEQIGLPVPEPFLAKAVVDAEGKITDILHRQARPYAKIGHRKVTANFANHDVTVVWTVDPGPRATFGPLRFSGLTSIKEAYLAAQVPWKEGQPYDADLVARYRKKLVGLDLFAMVQVEPAEALDASGQAPIQVKVIERKHRTVKGGVNYKTDEGPGANLSWENRNLFGGGEKLSVAATGSAIEQLGEITFEKPDFLAPKNLFTAKGKVADENKKAYKGQTAQTTAMVRRHFTDTLTAGAGLGYRASYIEKDESHPWEDGTRYGFIFLPTEATYDTRKDLLDPQQGVLASLACSPYWGTIDHGPNFVRPEFSVASYFKLLEKPGLVLATRIIGGANIGAERNDVSPDLRFYAGGSGSIRGYPYQTVGPLRGNTPVGGGSLFTFSAELRWRVTELIGVVPFLDGGSAFKNALAPYNQPILLGAGLGIRVYTPVGPVRLDVATPVTPRKDIDDIAQFYFSIGQSF